MIQAAAIKPYYDQDGITIYHGDCREILPTLGRFDLLLTDPPYGLGDRLTGGTGKWGVHFLEPPMWDREAPPDGLIHECVLKADDSVIWGGNYYHLPPARCWLSWDKMQDHTSGHFEMAWTTLDLPTRSFRESRVEAYSKGKFHPTQKPIGLIQWCVGFFPDAKSILDPFMGSGTTLLAAKLKGKQAVGIELEERYCEIAANRLAQGVLF